MATWPQNPRLIGTRIPRVDGLAKASGRAKYPSDVKPEGLLFGAMLYSPHSHAKIKSIDTTEAEKMPGVKAVHVIATEGKTLRYHGDDIAAVAAVTATEAKPPRSPGDDTAAVAAVTEEQARDAAHAIKVEYELLPHVSSEDDGLQKGNVKKGRATVTQKPDEAMASADATIEAT